MSPIRSSAAGASSRGYGVPKFAKYVSDISAQRLEGRKTGLSGAVNTTATLNQTPTAGNYLVVMLSSNAALVTASCAYGGTSGTLAVSNFTTGVSAYIYYIPLTSANIASGGTTLNITSASGPTIIGYAVCELTGVDPTTPLDTTQSNTSGGSTWSSANFPSVTANHTVIGGSYLHGVTLNGSQTTTGTTGGPGDYDSSGGTFGNHTASCDIYANTGSRSLSYTRSGTLTELLSGATGRNGIWLWASFRPAA